MSLFLTFVWAKNVSWLSMWRRTEVWLTWTTKKWCNSIRSTEREALKSSHSLATNSEAKNLEQKLISKLLPRVSMVLNSRCSQRLKSMEPMHIPSTVSSGSHPNYRTLKSRTTLNSSPGILLNSSLMSVEKLFTIMDQEMLQPPSRKKSKPCFELDLFEPYWMYWSFFVALFPLA